MFAWCLTAAALASCGEMDNEARVQAYVREQDASFAVVMDTLIQRTGADLQRIDCGTPPPVRRLGYCRATGPQGGRFPELLGLVEADEATTTEWRTSSQSGCAEVGWVREHRGAALFAWTPNLSVPPLGVAIERVWVDSSAVCLDLSIPWSE